MNKARNNICLWNNQADGGGLGLCNLEPDAYPLLPGDCPCDDFVALDADMSRVETGVVGEGVESE